MNLLILSCGTRNKLIEFFKQSSKFERIVVTDCSPYAPALYTSDKYYLVPRMNEPSYLDCILNICKTEEINGILPLQEDELDFLAKHRHVFLNAGVLPIVSSVAAVETCRDKFAFFQHLKNHSLPVLKTYNVLSSFDRDYAQGMITFPVFLKPVRGCGSIAIHVVKTREELEFLFSHNQEAMLIQEYATGEEYGADLYIDMVSHTLSSIFVKKKLRMRAGETEKSISIVDADLFSLIEETVSTLDLSGPIDMDIFQVNGSYYISEINPRFGGGYPHAYACGIDFPSMIAHNTAGLSNDNTVGHYKANICYLKYSDGITIDMSNTIKE